MKRAYFIFILLIFLICMMILSTGIGSVFFSPMAVVKLIANIDGPINNSSRTILLGLRMPRVILSALVGFGLGIAGAAFQGVFRNPLADPYIIGASSGASFGAAVALTAGIPFLTGAGPAVFAFAGSLCTVILVFLVAGAGQKTPPAVSLLLAGTAVSAFLSSAVTFLLIFKSQDVIKIFYWLLGSFNNSSWNNVITVSLFLIPGSLILQAVSYDLDLMSFGDESAGSSGVSVTRVRYAVIGAATIITAAAVSVSGIIGFAGLISPHISRIIFGPLHRRLFITSGITGAILLVSADLVARTVLYPVELPVGIITAVLGAPFFLYILNKKGKEHHS